MNKILLIEDDSKLAGLISTYLDKYGYEVQVADDFGDILDVFIREQPDLVLMDVNLPKFDGFYWCRQIRIHSHCPILFISARDSGMDQVMALENGADDYITKPFDYEVVLAKIRSHLRRAYGDYAKSGERKIEAGKLQLLPERLIVQTDSATAELTQKEGVLLEALMLKVGRLVSREHLLNLMWKDEHFIDDNTLNVYITRVRKKLKEMGADEQIETVRGAGYILIVPAEELG